MKITTRTARAVLSALYDLGLRLPFDAADFGLGAELVFKPIKPRQTDAQRGYYWQAITAWGKAQGLTASETERHLHPVICCECWGVKEYKNINGCVIPIPNQTSAKQRRDQYSDLIQTLIYVAAREGFHIESPGERVD